MDTCFAGDLCKFAVTNTSLLSHADDNSIGLCSYNVKMCSCMVFFLMRILYSHLNGGM